MILYKRFSILINASEIHLINPDMFFDAKDMMATYTTNTNENCPVTSRKTRFVHHPIHKLQLNGFGITHLKCNHFDNADSISWMKPDKSMIKQIKICIKTTSR